MFTKICPKSLLFSRRPSTSFLPQLRHPVSAPSTVITRIRLLSHVGKPTSLFVQENCYSKRSYSTLLFDGRRQYSPMVHPFRRASNRHHVRYVSFTTDDDNDPHKLFKAQMQELEAERKSVFGEDDDIMDRNDPDISNDLVSQANRHHERIQTELLKTSSQSHIRNEVPSSEEESLPSTSMTQDEIDDMNEDRAALFQFSEQEKHAWGTGPKPISKNLMKKIEDARRKQFDDQAQQPEQSSSIYATDKTTTTENTNDIHHESFSHVSKDGTSIHMVDVGHKQVTTRMAQAQTKVVLPDEVLQAFSTSSSNTADELIGPKGPIFATAKLAGIMAAKKTSDLIPLCHPLPLDQVKIDIRLDPTDKNVVVIDCTCRVTHKTGVEMEALTGSSVAALTIYDMVKAVSHQVEISNTKLLSKTGGKRRVLDGNNERDE